MAADVAALQQKLAAIHRQKDDVEKKLQEMRPGGRRRDPVDGANNGGSPPRGSLLSRLGGRVGEGDRGDRGGGFQRGRAGEGGRRAGGGEQEGGPRGRKRGGYNDDEDDHQPRKRRIASAVSVPGRDEEPEEEGEIKGKAAQLPNVNNDDRWDDGIRPSTSGGGGGEDNNEEREPRARRVVGGGGRGGRLAARMGERQPRKIDVEAELKVEERGDTKEIYKKADVQKRDRRMFGALMGHLGKAKQQLHKDEDILKKQNAVEKNVSDKTKEEGEKIRQAVRETRMQERLIEEKKKSALVLEQRKIEKELDTARYAAYWNQFRKFIKTKAEPSLFYLPATMSDETKALLEESGKSIDEMIEKKKEEEQQAKMELEEAFKERWEKGAKEGKEGDDDEEDEEEGDEEDEEKKGPKKVKKKEDEEEEEEEEDKKGKANGHAAKKKVKEDDSDDEEEEAHKEEKMKVEEEDDD